MNDAGDSAKLDVVRKFGALVFDVFFGDGGDIGGIDGDDLLGLALKAGLLREETIETDAGCGEGCNCVGNGARAGDTCYRMTITHAELEANWIEQHAQSATRYEYRKPPTPEEQALSTRMQQVQHAPDNTAKWESGELGTSAEHTRRASPEDEAAINEAVMDVRVFDAAAKIDAAIDAAQRAEKLNEVIIQMRQAIELCVFTGNNNIAIDYVRHWETALENL